LICGYRLSGQIIYAWLITANLDARGAAVNPLDKITNSPAMNLAFIAANVEVGS
jgi:hypothetical protein